MKMKSWVTSAILGVMLAGSATPAYATEDSLTLKPARQEGTAKDGVLLGPFGVVNTTSRSYHTRVFPAFLQQFRDGGVVLNQSPASLRRAAKLVRVATDGFPFAPGDQRSAAGQLVHPTDEHNFYGAISFQSNPLREPGKNDGASIRQAFALNAAVLLAPPAELQRPTGETEACYAEQSGPRRLRYRIPFRATGNIDMPATGNVIVSYAAGPRASEATVQPIKVFPTFIVDTRADEPGKLPKGNYKLRATIHARGGTWTSECEMTLVDVNTLQAADAELESFPNPRVYFGERFDVEATYRNTGNVPFRPRAELVLRYATGPKRTRVFDRFELDAARSDAAAIGRIMGEIEALPTRDNFEAQLRLLTPQGRELDSQSLVIVQQHKPDDEGAASKWWIIPAILLALLFLFLLWRRSRRERRENDELRDRLARLESDRNRSSSESRPTT